MAGLRHFIFRRIEDIQVLLMTVMFVSFIIQIGSCYVFNAPVDWSFELILISWLWAVFWGAAFLLKDNEQVKFDVIYNMCAERTRRLFALLSAVVIAGALLASAPATYDFIEFKKIRSTDMIGVRFDLVYGVYLIFLAGTVFHYGVRIYKALTNAPMSELEREQDP